MKILVFHASAGQGHKKAAEVVGKALLAHGNDSLDIEVLDALDFMPDFSKKNYLNFYYYCVKYIPNLWGWFYEFTDRPNVYKNIRPIRRLYNQLISKRLVEKIMRDPPDLIVSTHFFASEVAAHLKATRDLKSRLITVVTDFMPHTFWINAITDAYWVMAEDTKKDLVRRGVPEPLIFAKGIPVESVFKKQDKKNEMLEKHGLSKERFTILLTSGSFGFAAYEAVLKELAVFSDKIQAFVVCGNNQAVKCQLEKLSFSYPVKVFGFVNFMHELMEASDLMIAKSGGLTSSEGLAKGIPMVVTQPIPGQETRNVDFLKFHEAAFFIQSPEQVKLIVDNILKHPTLLESKRLAIARIAKPDAALDLARFAFELCRQNT